MGWEEKFIEKNIAMICMEWDKIKGANTNLARMAPDYIDGLKPVSRRLLTIMRMKDGGRTLRKVATIVGDTIGKLHHHGPSSVYSCLVGLAQWWNNNIPLIQGQGNFGTVAGDGAGADRYIQARLSAYSLDCFCDDDSVLDMIMGADGETMEPVYYAAKYMNVLINGDSGIGYGKATNIPPFNFKEVHEAIIKLMADPDADIILIPDSPTGCDVVQGNFLKISDMGSGVYTMRCKYEIDSEENIIRIIALPYQVDVSNKEGNGVRDKIADIRVNGGLPELIDMKDLSGKVVDLRLYIRHDVNPHKFMKKLIDEVAGLEKSYPVNITVTNDYESFDYSIKRLMVEWIRYRREQKRVVVTHKRTTLLAEQRTNDVKIFLMHEDNLQLTINIFKSSRNRSEIEQRLIARYKDSEIRMDSLQAKTLSEMRMYQLSLDAYEECIKRKDELIEELKGIEEILNDEHGIDKVIISELRDGIKKYGHIRRSNVVPHKIDTNVEVVGSCILQLSSDGMILRRLATNVDEEPVPVDNNGFATKVENDCSFIAIDEDGYFSFVRVKELPVDEEVPLNRYIKRKLGNIIALLPYDIESDKCCTLITRRGTLKKIRISEMRPSQRPCIEITKGDQLVRGIVAGPNTSKDILVYTRDGMGQRLDPNEIRVTSFLARGGSGFKLRGDDEIVGCYLINPENQYLVYVTTKGKMRLNLTQYLPMRDSKHDEMVRLIILNDRDRLHSVTGCNKLDKLQIYFNDGDSEIVNISKMEEGTMSSEPKKVTKKNAVSSSIVKVKLI